MNEEAVIGIDLGGTWLRGAIIHDSAIVSGTSRLPGTAPVGEVSGILYRPIDNKVSSSVLLDALYDLIHELMTVSSQRYSIRAIGIGVPGLADPGSGMVYDVLNIPSWKELSLRSILEQRSGLPVFIDNDANCFAWGEYIFGKGRGSNSLIGLTIGTGLGAGIVLNGRLYSGASGAAGEFGMVGYLDKNYEYYASGSFFRDVHGLDGQTVFERAAQEDPAALQLYSEFGAHLGKAIGTILYTYDPELILLGGSVSKAWSYFQDSLYQALSSHALARSLQRVKIDVSELDNSAILGAAALCTASR